MLMSREMCEVAAELMTIVPEFEKWDIARSYVLPNADRIVEWQRKKTIGKERVNVSGYDGASWFLSGIGAVDRFREPKEHASFVPSALQPEEPTFELERGPVMQPLQRDPPRKPLTVDQLRKLLESAQSEIGKNRVDVFAAMLEMDAATTNRDKLDAMRDSVTALNVFF